MKKLPIIALVGRTNVGKSTLFNRLTEKKNAIVSKLSWTTRDRKYGIMIWNAREMTIVDTGGMEQSGHKTDSKNAEDDIVLQQKIMKQTAKAMKEAKIVCHIVDYTTGVLEDDKKIAALLIRTNKPNILVINKCDRGSIDQKKIKAFLSLGLGNPIRVSAINGHGTDILLDKILERLDTMRDVPNTAKPALTPAPTPITPSTQFDAPKEFDATNINDTTAMKIAFIGKPNVGKSSLINAIISEERTIVHSKAYTTREPQEIPFIYQNKKIILIDTVGMRKTAKVDRGLESKGVAMSIEKLREGYVAIIVLDVSEPLAGQDKHLTMIAEEFCHNIIMVANKWDLIEDKQPNTINGYTKTIRRHFPYLNFVPLVFVSAKHKQGIDRMLDLVLYIQKMNNKVITDEALQAILKNVITPKVYSFSQVKTDPQTFLLICKDKVPVAICNIITKKIRERFDLIGMKINLNVKIHRTARPELER